MQVCGSERRCLDFLRRASCVFRCSATMPAFAWSHARNAALVQVCGSERRCSDLQDVPRVCSDAVRRCLHLHEAVQGTLHLCKSAVQSDDARTSKTCLVHVPMQCEDACICMEPCKERCTCVSRLTRVMGNVYVFSRIKTAFSGALWLRFRDGVVELPAPPPC